MVTIGQVIKPVFAIFDISPACASASKECLGAFWLFEALSSFGS
ncbi:MAG: hypothetical protein E6738_06390 [Campylobacter concisus]|nr:hypothetical protein [Campylobacter concisus]